MYNEILYLGDRKVMKDGVIWHVGSWQPIALGTVRDLLGIPRDVKLAQYVVSLNRMVGEDNTSFAQWTTQVGAYTVLTDEHNNLVKIEFVEGVEWR